MRWILLSLAGLLLAGCVYRPAGYYGPPAKTVTTLESVNSMVGVNQPVEYRVGFRDGCDSGYVSAGNGAYTFSKDSKRYGEDDKYQQGWDDGFERCKQYGLSAPVYYPSYYYGMGPYPEGYYLGYYPGYYSSGFYYPWYSYSYSPHLHYDRHWPRGGYKSYPRYNGSFKKPSGGGHSGSFKKSSGGGHSGSFKKSSGGSHNTKKRGKPKKRH